MMNILSRLTGSNSSERVLKKIEPLVEEINALEDEYEAMSDDELRAVTAELKGRLAEGGTLHEILPDAFAAVRTAAKRTIGQRHYDVQLLGGAVLHQGKIAEMRTGEGKTLVATLPAYLNSLTGRGVHVVTVNDYLARRDPQWMGPIYHLLGVSVASIQHDTAFLYDPGYVGEDVSHNHLRPISRREAYEADITYGTNNEFGFDYLRDNMVLDLAGRVQRPLHYAIVDEVDNILIDEARTPLIISGTAEESAEQYRQFARIAPMLRPGQDFEIDEKYRQLSLTEAGIAKVERVLQVDNLYDPAHFELTHYLDNALKAQFLFHRDQHYTVKDGEVIIVDEFTGRLMPGRRWSDGLHQAVEAKEHVRVKEETITLATITFQNYFRLYKKLAGMTGTAWTEREEFDKIYRLDVVVIPTHREMIRKDNPDLVFKSEEGKFRAVVNEIAEMVELQRPVLVGTVSIEKSEYLSELLKRRGIDHQVLNAKLHEKEAGIVAQAGQPGAVTVATNMAGRGTDIILGGNVEGMAQEILRRRGIEAVLATDEEWHAALAEAQVTWEENRQQVLAGGGLHIVGTERHEARRIDNQLRGRAGRQGDPGSSRFYVSLEDDVMRRFGTDRVKSLMGLVGLEEDMPLEHRLVDRALEAAQTKVEGMNFDARKHVVEYDDVMNKQREVIYAERNKILAGADLRANIRDMIERELRALVRTYLPDRHGDNWDVEAFVKAAEAILSLPPDLGPEQIEQMSRDEVEDRLIEWSEELYDQRGADLGEQVASNAELRRAFTDMIAGELQRLVRAHVPERPGEDWDVEAFVKAAEAIRPLPPELEAEEIAELGRDEVEERLLAWAREGDALGAAELGSYVMRRTEREVMLRTIDGHWIQHLTAMEEIRQGIHLRAIGQTDPLVAYKREGHQMFEDLLATIQRSIVHSIYHATNVVIVAQTPSGVVSGNGRSAGGPARPAASRQTSTNREERPGNGQGRATPVRGPIATKIGRNDLCYCGSGLKYKRCHGAAAGGGAPVGRAATAPSAVGGAPAGNVAQPPASPPGNGASGAGPAAGRGTTGGRRGKNRPRR
jgi:preprotein translocase subunit SecA